MKIKAKQRVKRADLNSGGVEINPSTVNSFSILKIYSYIQTTIPNGGFIRVVFPSEVTTNPSTSCTITRPTGMTATCTYSLTATNHIQLLAKLSGGSILDYFELNVQNFKNPASTTKLSSFQIFTLDASSQLLDNQQDFVFLQATSDSFSTVSMTSDSNKVGETGKELTITFTTKNLIPIGGKVYVKFPYWNSDAQGTQFTLQSYLTSTSPVSCTGLRNIATSPTCGFDTATQTLTITNSFFGAAVTSGTIISFKLGNFRNPLTTQVVSGFVISTGDASTGLIDSATQTLQMSIVGSITTASVKPDLTTVQELTRYRVEFFPPVPLSQGCILEIVFPSQITLDQSQLTLVQAFGLPSTQRTISGTIDKTLNSYLITNACPSYRDNSNSAIVYFQNIKNPIYVMTTNSIEINIYDKNSQMIISTLGVGPTVTTTFGSINTQALTSDQTEINSETTVKFSIQPLHQTIKNSKIIITLPIGQMRVLSSCNIQGLNLISSSSTCQTDSAANTISIFNAFQNDYTYSSSQNVEFKISYIKLPPTTGVTGSYTFQVYTQNLGIYYLVDQQTSSNLYKATNGVLLSGSVSTLSLFSAEVTSYTLSFRVKNAIIKGGYVVITLPSQLTIPNPSTSACSNFVNFEATATCIITSNTVRVNDGFKNANFELFTDLKVTISGLKNPRSLQTTGSFTVQTYSSLGDLIDIKTDQMTVTMKDTNVLTTQTVQSNTLVVGSVNYYTFTIASPTPLVNGDKVLIQFPTQLNQPLANTLSSCSGVTNLASSLPCSISGPYGVIVTLSFTQTMTANQAFSFIVRNVANPSSTLQTDLFTAEILDSTNEQVNKNNAALDAFRVKMAQGAPLKTITVAHQITRPFVVTAFTFTFKLENPLPANGQVWIYYPKQITADASQFNCSVSQSTASPKCTIDTSKQNILVKDAANLQVAAGTTFTVNIYGLINSKLAAQTNSFQIETRTSDGNIINYAYQYLTVTNDCDYPCLTCQSGSPSKCLTCDIISQYKLILNNQCIETCPSTYFSLNNQCLKCESQCAECLGEAGFCTKCSAGFYKEGSNCVKKCSSDQYVEDAGTQECLKCKSPCQTCSGKTTICTSCLENQDKNLLYMGFCYSNCPLSSVASGTTTCIPCDSNCLGCSESPSTCTSCYLPLKLNKLDNTCVDTCPVGKTTDSGTTCEYCDPLCRTCELTNVKKCLSCNPGLSYFQKDQTCVGVCPQGTTQITGSDGLSICKTCDAGCKKCQKTSDYCTECDDKLGYLFYKFKCYKDDCPTGYTRLSTTRNICVREGYVCPYGYEFNNFGECELVLQICREGYKLNSDKTKCIPVPGAYIPLIFLIAIAIWTGFVIYKYRKTHAPIDIITMLLTFYTFVQTVSYITMLGLAFELDYVMVKGVHMMAFISMYLANAIFGLVFHLKYRKEDPAFVHWYSENKKWYNIYKYTIFIFNFKSIRGIYSQLFPPRTYFNAGFSDRYKNLIKPLFLVTVFNYVIQVMPVIAMDIYNFIYIPWGYQIMVMSIDNMIMGLGIFILEIIEFAHYKKLAIQEGNLMQNQRGYLLRKMPQDDNVMSVIEDENSMMSLNKDNLLRAQDATFDYEKKMIISESGRKSHLKRQEATEKEVLEKLVRKLNEEQKFNRIYDDQDEDQVNLMDPLEREKLRQTQILLEDPMAQDKRKKYEKEQLREKVENKLSFRQQVVQPGPHQTYLQKKIYNDLQYPLFGDRDLSSYGLLDVTQDPNNTTLDIINQTMIEPSAPIKQQQNEENLESARTEKFEHQRHSDQEIISKDFNQSQKLGNKTRSMSTQNLLRQLALHDIDFDEPSKNIEEFNKFKKEFQEDLEKQRRELNIKKRDCQSCDDEIMREWYDDMAPESDFDRSEFSHESYPNNTKKLNDVEYLAKLELFRERLKFKYHYNNCYTHINDPYNKKSYNLAKTKNVTRRTQTYEKDIAIGYDPFAKDHNYQHLLDEDMIAELDLEFMPNLIENLIDNISSEESFIEMKKDTVPEEDQANSDDSDFDFEKIKQSKKRKKDIQFDLDDIIGMFDIDDFGNIMLNRDTMRDNLNRKVNNNGYLIDNQRNIVNQDGVIIFEFAELDENEEIPLPYRFEKRKKQLLKQEEKFHQVHSERQFDIDSILQGEEDKIEEEFQKLKDVSRPSSVDSMIGDLPTKFDKNIAENPDNSDGAIQSQPFDLGEDGFAIKNEDSARKRDRELAKAYGGKPPKAKKKKRTNKKKKSELDGDRQLTDRLFPYLQQEEERVKRMAMISYGIQNNSAVKPINSLLEETKPDELRKTKDFESFFKDQMKEIQQYRQEAKDQLALQQVQSQPPFQITEQMTDEDLDVDFPAQQIQFYHDDNQNAENIKRIDSATTDKTFMNNWGSQALQNQQQEVQPDPMQELIQQDAEKANRFFERVNRNKQNQSAAYKSNSGNQSQLIRNQQILNTVNAASNMNFYQANPMLNNQPQSILSMSSIPLNQMDTGDDQNFNHIMPQDKVLQTGSVQAKKFDFYLPVSKGQAQVKKNLLKGKEKKDISFSEIGRMQLAGNAKNSDNNNNGERKIKGLEKVYLQRYPAPPKTTQGESRTIYGGAGGNVGQKRKLLGQGQFRSNTINDSNQLNRINNRGAYDQNLSGSAGVNEGFNQMLNQDLVDYDSNPNHTTSGGRLQVTTGQYENLNQLQNNNWF
ncbi:UNKNOWN [Stylonychia lemnae]|uniref:FU domain containing protein n=1 Tax=Stylonychia lemnae TaxID=5949 RepID=A0A077ZV41_STYLE|nr:UNKNOWN [Stylonychia lemnae]|eukprot:CDW73754.1 UNKNOWN [Stylonychia lemnae]